MDFRHSQTRMVVLFAKYQMKKWLYSGLINAIKCALWVLDRDHRSCEEISPTDDKKMTHIQNVDFKSDFGTASRAFRTVPYTAWELRTATKTLIGADKHRVIRANGHPVWMEDLVAGDMIKTDTGDEAVVSSKSLNVRTHMYCIEVHTDDARDPNNHLYFSDGILSHNTTTAGSYLLWRAMFVPDTKILIVANKLKAALEVMARVKYAYEECPDWLKAGSKKCNEGTLMFDNGSIIEAVATTPDAARGKSLSLLYCDEFAFVPPNMANPFWTSVLPTLSTGGGCIITSTPKTDEDQFAQIWKGAQVKTEDQYGNPIENPPLEGPNGFFAVKVPWWEHPERDEEWAAEYRESLGEAKFAQEFECVNGETTITTDIGPMSVEHMFRLLEMSN